MLGMRCRCGVTLDKPWMIRAHRCEYTIIRHERMRFWKRFIIVECMLVAFTVIAYLLRL
jgi:hypothetical protein